MKKVFLVFLIFFTTTFHSLHPASKADITIIRILASLFKISNNLFPPNTQSNFVGKKFTNIQIVLKQLKEHLEKKIVIDSQPIRRHLPTPHDICLCIQIKLAGHDGIKQLSNTFFNFKELLLIKLLVNLLPWSHNLSADPDMVIKPPSYKKLGEILSNIFKPSDLKHQVILVRYLYTLLIDTLEHARISNSQRSDRDLLIEKLYGQDKEEATQKLMQITQKIQVKLQQHNQQTKTFPSKQNILYLNNALQKLFEKKQKENVEIPLLAQCWEESVEDSMELD